MRVLVTRPRQDAAGIARALAERGHEALIEPLLQVVFLSGAAVPLDGAQGILATSANGVRALAAATPRRDLVVWAVGEATGRTARREGFPDVRVAGGDVTALAALVAAHADPAAGALVHAAGSVLAGDLAGLLAARGFETRRTVLYEARPAESLSSATTQALVDRDLGAALFFSPRTGGTFATLLRHARLGGVLETVHAVCLSAAVAGRLDGLAWAGLHVAERPEQESLLAAFDRAAASAR